MSSGERSPSSLTSAPAENARPDPVTTTQALKRTSSRARLSPSSRSSAVESAFSFSSRRSVSTQIAPSWVTSTRGMRKTYSFGEVGLLASGGFRSTLGVSAHEEGRMRRFTLLLAALAVGAATAAVVATAGPAKTTSFKFCSDPTFPPMESKTTSGSAVGFDIEMASAIATSWGGKATFVQTAFPGLLPALSAKKCDVVISGIFITPDRTKQFPAVSYMKSHRALVVRAGNPKHITSPNSLKGKHVAVQAGTKYEEYLKALKAKLG